MTAHAPQAAGGARRAACASTSKRGTRGDRPPPARSDRDPFGAAQAARQGPSATRRRRGWDRSASGQAGGSRGGRARARRRCPGGARRATRRRTSGRGASSSGCIGRPWPATARAGPRTDATRASVGRRRWPITKSAVRPTSTCTRTPSGSPRAEARFPSGRFTTSSARRESRVIRSTRRGRAARPPLSSCCSTLARIALPSAEAAQDRPERPAHSQGCSK